MVRGPEKADRLLRGLLVATVELVDTPGGVNKLLLAGEERMALGADANVDFRTGGFDVPDFAAGANHFGRAIFRMNITFHFAYSIVWVYIIYVV